MKIKNRITRIIEEEKLLSGDDTFDDILPQAQKQSRLSAVFKHCGKNRGKIRFVG